MNSKICALLLLIALGPVPIKADEFFPGTEPIDAAVRLESIKSSLLDYALDHSVYVSTQAWLDGNGAVEEKVLLLSGLNLERVRVIVLVIFSSGLSFITYSRMFKAIGRGTQPINWIKVIKNWPVV